MPKLSKTTTTATTTATTTKNTMTKSLTVKQMYRIRLQSQVLNILNTGTKKSLQELATIGKTRAGQIFDYR